MPIYFSSIISYKEKKFRYNIGYCTYRISHLLLSTYKNVKFACKCAVTQYTLLLNTYKNINFAYFLLKNSGLTNLFNNDKVTKGKPNEGVACVKT